MITHVEASECGILIDVQSVVSGGQGTVQPRPIVIYVDLLLVSTRRFKA